MWFKIDSGQNPVSTSETNRFIASVLSDDLRLLLQYKLTSGKKSKHGDALYLGYASTYAKNKSMPLCKHLLKSKKIA